MIRQRIQKVLFMTEERNIEKLAEGFIWDFLKSDVKNFIQGGLAQTAVKKFDNQLAKALKSDNKTIEKGLSILKKAYQNRLIKLNKLKYTIAARIDNNKTIPKEVREQVKQTIMDRIHDNEEILAVLDDEKNELEAEATPKSVTKAEEPPVDEEIDEPEQSSEEEPEPEPEAEPEVTQEPEDNKLDDIKTPIGKELYQNRNDALDFLVSKNLLSGPAQERFQKLTDENKKIVIDYAIEQFQNMADTIRDIKAEQGDATVAEAELSDFGDFKPLDFHDEDRRQIDQWIRKNLTKNISSKVTALHRHQIQKQEIKESIRRALCENVLDKIKQSAKDSFSSAIDGSLSGKDVKIEDPTSTFRTGDIIYFDDKAINNFKRKAKQVNKTQKADKKEPVATRDPKDNAMNKIKAGKSGLTEQEELDDFKTDLKKIAGKDKTIGIIKKLDTLEDGTTYLTVKLMDVSRSTTNKENVRLKPVKKQVKILAEDAEMLRRGSKLPEKIKKLVAISLGAGLAGAAFLAQQGRAAGADSGMTTG